MVHTLGLWAVSFLGKLVEGGKVAKDIYPIPCSSPCTWRQPCWDQICRTWTINRKCLSPAVNEAIKCNYQGDAEP